MTIGTLHKLVHLASELPNSARVVTRGDYLHGPHGIYDLPGRTEIVYICCAMGGCSWRHTPAPHYERALYWNGED